MTVTIDTLGLQTPRREVLGNGIFRGFSWQRERVQANEPVRDVQTRGERRLNTSLGTLLFASQASPVVSILCFFWEISV